MIVLLIVSCDSTPSVAEPLFEPKEEVSTPEETLQEGPVEDWKQYPFLTGTEGIQPISVRFPPPDDYKRVKVESASFGEWLRNLPVLDRQTVYSYRGDAVSAPAAAVVPMDVGSGDVQQCADSILRLYSEFLWAKKDVDKWGIHFTSGDLSTWSAWRQGERFKVAGSTVERTKSGGEDRSYTQYQRWLHHSFLYAGTRSMNKDSLSVEPSEEVQPGDFFVTGGSPGHAILVIDVAESAGKPRVALLGQGYMPAQEFHVLEDTGSHVKANWFVLPSEGEALRNPSWKPIPRSVLYRFP